MARAILTYLREGQQVERERLRVLVKWNPHYRSEWDATPDVYVDAGFVSWGKSRRLGRLQSGRVKAYIGVQHVDPDRAGWAVVETAQARYFVSLFIDGRIITLRSFDTVDSTLDWLSEATQ